MKRLVVPTAHLLHVGSNESMINQMFSRNSTSLRRLADSLKCMYIVCRALEGGAGGEGAEGVSSPSSRLQHAVLSALADCGLRAALRRDQLVAFCQDCRSPTDTDAASRLALYTGHCF